MKLMCDDFRVREVPYSVFNQDMSKDSDYVSKSSFRLLTKVAFKTN